MNKFFAVIVVSLIGIIASSASAQSSCQPQKLAAQLAKSNYSYSAKLYQRAQRNYDATNRSYNRTIARFDSRIGSAQARINYYDSLFDGEIVAFFFGGGLTASKGARLHARIEQYKTYRNSLIGQKATYITQVTPQLARVSDSLTAATADYNAKMAAFDSAYNAYYSCVYPTPAA